MEVLIAAALVIAILTEVLIWRRRAPRTSEDYVRAGDNALNRGHLDLAGEHYREAVRLDHGNAEAHYGLATAAMHRGDFDGAIDHLHQCQEWADNVPLVHHALGVAHYHKGDLEGALVHHRRAVELDPEAEESRRALADVYHALGRTEEAKEVYPDFVPTPPEEVERQKRVAARLSPQTSAQLQRWERAGHALVWLFRLSRAGVLTYVAFLVLAVLHHLTLGSGKVEYPNVPPVAVAAFGCSLLCMYVARLGLRAMEGASDTFLRWVLRRSDVSEEDVEAVVPREYGPPWWRVELSGMHLLLWLGLPVLVVGFKSPGALPPWAIGVLLYMVFAWILKGGFWLAFLLVEADRRGAWHRRYEWFRTLRGTLFAAVAVPAIALAMVLVPLGICELLDLVF